MACDLRQLPEDIPIVIKLKFTTTADQFRWTHKGSHGWHLPIPDKINSIGVRLGGCEQGGMIQLKILELQTNYKQK